MATEEALERAKARALEAREGEKEAKAESRSLKRRWEGLIETTTSPGRMIGEDFLGGGLGFGVARLGKFVFASIKPLAAGEDPTWYQRNRSLVTGGVNAGLGSAIYLGNALAGGDKLFSFFRQNVRTGSSVLFWQGVGDVVDRVGQIWLSK